MPSFLLNRRRLIKSTGAASLLAASGLSNRAFAQSVPDLILIGGDIITQDPGRPHASALAIKDGLVQRTGDDETIRAMASKATQVIELGGRTVIPGLNDSHQHPTRGGRFYAAELRWDGLSSLERGLQMIREQAARTPDGAWVRVIGGWSPYQFDEKRMPTTAELTEAAPNTPVYVLFLYSQGFLNAAAVQARGLSPATKAPPGTRYEFTEDGGAILHAVPNPDLLYGSIGALPPLSDEEQAISTQHYYRELNRFGLTSVIDAGGGGHRYPEDYRGTAVLAEAGDMPIRVSKYLFPQDKGAEIAEFENWTENFEAGHNYAQELAHGYEVEGGGEFLVWSAGDYENFLAPRPSLADRPGWRRELVRVTRHLLENRWPLRIHATYDQSANNIMDAFEEAHQLEKEAGRQGFDGVRWAFDHGETYTPETLRRLKRLGGGIAVQARLAYAGEYFLERYGREITRNSPPLRDMIELGLPMGLGTDGTRVSSYNPWPALYWATTGRSVGGTPLHGPRHRLSRREALYHYTVGSAWFSQEESQKGRLAAGQFADLAVLNAPYLDVSDEDLKSIQSDLTVTGGKIVFGQGPYREFNDALPAIEPEWSPVGFYGGFQA